MIKEYQKLDLCVSTPTFQFEMHNPVDKRRRFNVYRRSGRRRVCTGKKNSYGIKSKFMANDACIFLPRFLHLIFCLISVMQSQ